MIAARHGHINAFKKLLELGANFFLTCSKLNNILHYGLKGGNEALVRFIS